MIRRMWYDYTRGAWVVFLFNRYRKEREVAFWRRLDYNT